MNFFDSMEKFFDSIEEFIDKSISIFMAFFLMASLGACILVIVLIPSCVRKNNEEIANALYMNALVRK